MKGFSRRSAAGLDRILSIHSQPDGSFGNTCSGCHAPTAGMSDTQSIAIGIDPDPSHGVVGPNRKGARNQRRTPSVINNAFYPRLMWDGRFFAPSGSPFDNSQGFAFPPPEGTTRFPPSDKDVTHLLIAQAHIPPTENPEMSGFTGAKSLEALNVAAFRLKTASLDDGPAITEPTAAMSTFSNRQPASNQAALARFTGTEMAPCERKASLFDDGHGTAVPFASDNVSEATRALVEARVNKIPGYVQLFAAVFADVKNTGKVSFTHVAQAIAEFEMSLSFASAPIDMYARGDKAAMTDSQKRGAVVFFRDKSCVSCHAVSGQSNEMFSDFKNRQIAVPQIAPEYGPGKGNFLFDGDTCDQDFGAFNSAGEDVADKESLKYKFRTSPLRNVGAQPTFFHNGAFTRLEDAIRHHLDVAASVSGYDAAKAGVAADLTVRKPSNQALLNDVDPLLRNPVNLSAQEFSDLVEFVRVGLMDERAKKENLCKLVPKKLPSGLIVGTYEGCQQ